VGVIIQPSVAQITGFDVSGPLNENVRVREFEVDQNYQGWRLDHFLSDRIPRLSRTQANQIIRYGDISIEPHRVLKPSTKLKYGELIVLKEHLPPELVQDDEVQILFQDDSILLLSKPAGMLVHEAGQIRLNTVQEYLVRLGYLEAEPAHRIDKETSGIVLCVLNRELLPKTRGLFADHKKVTKTYRAVVDDADHFWTPGAQKTIDIPLGLDPTSFLGVRMTRGDLACRTYATCLRVEVSDGQRFCDLEVQIETGRQHQIRAHMALCGTPIVGDKLYTFDDEFFAAITDRPCDPELLGRLATPRHMLHAWKIEFEHPKDAIMVSAQSPLPKIWSDFFGQSEENPMATRLSAEVTS